MGFSSTLYPGEKIIDDGTQDRHLLDPNGRFGSGLDLSLRTESGYAGTASAFPSELLIPRSDWPAIIQEKEEKKSRTSDLCLAYNLPCKDQQQTNYCWINAPTHSVEIVRLQQNAKMVILSPASAGAPIKGFKNVGGWGKEGLDWIIQYGLVPIEFWPANSINRQYYTAENKAMALKYRITEWIEVVPRNLDQHVSLLLRNIPVPVGLNYWSHEVTDQDAVWLDGAIAIRFRNSWGMGWGSQGYGIRQGSKMYADDAVAPSVALIAA